MNNNQDNYNNFQQNGNVESNMGTTPINVIPESKNIQNNINNQNTFINLNQNNQIQNFEQQINQKTEELNQEENPMIMKQQNKFINENIDTTNTALNNLNVDGTYNNMPPVDYSQDPKVKENLEKKNTITITSEGKIFIIIIVVLLIFVFVLPTIFDLITTISYS